METIKTILAIIITIFWGVCPVLADSTLEGRLVFLCFWIMSLIVIMPIVFYLIKK